VAAGPQLVVIRETLVHAGLQLSLAQPPKHRAVGITEANELHLDELLLSLFHLRPLPASRARRRFRQPTRILLAQLRENCYIAENLSTNTSTKSGV